MKLLFLGTKGEIEEYNDRHQYNSSLLVTGPGARLLIDYGMIHRYALEEVAPDAVLITHAHPDTYVWLKKDIKTDIPVYVTRETLEYGRFRPSNPVLMSTGQEHRAGALSWSCYSVIHSLRCPAVGFKLNAEGKTIVYNSDVVDILDRDKILGDADYYIGDASAIRANLVRRRGNQLFGHTRITTQINWCKSYGIKNIIFTHLGKETLEKEDQFKQDHPEVVLAYDGMEMVV